MYLKIILVVGHQILFFLVNQIITVLDYNRFSHYESEIMKENLETTTVRRQPLDSFQGYWIIFKVVFISHIYT